MKIVILSSSSLPSNTANSIQVVSMASAFSEMGHDVVLVGRVRDTDSRKTAESLHDHYGVANSFRVVLVPWQTPSILSGAFYVLRAVRAIRLLNPEIVLSRNVLGSLMLCALGFPLIHESHSTEGSWLGRIFFSLMLRSRNLIGLVAISESLAKHLEGSHQISRRSILVAHDGARPLGTGAKAVSSPKSGPSFRVGYAGSFYRGRGIDLIVQIAQRCDWATFVLIGDHSVTREDWLGDISNIELIGEVPPLEVRQHLVSFDVALAPYQVDTSDRRGNVTAKWMSPLKIFEYMAARVPIIASDLPAIREILTNDINALLVDPNNPDSWISAIELLNQDLPLASEIASNAQDLLLSQYTWESRAASILRFAEERKDDIRH